MVIDGGGATIELITYKKIHEHASRYEETCRSSSE
jgi:hypothetical protein